MKTPHLFASLAVAATASAAEPKDATEVAREWNENTYVDPSPITRDLSFRGQATPPSLSAWPVTIIDCWTSKPEPPEPVRNPMRRAPLIDAPRNLAPDKLPNDRPRGAIPWEYDGRVFWLVPLAPGADK